MESMVDRPFRTRHDEIVRHHFTGMDISITEEVSALGAFIKSVERKGIRVERSRQVVFDALSGNIRVMMAERGLDLERLPGERNVRSLRKFYWKISVDPTKTRPSSEALARRLLRKGLPMINSLVDAGNLASVETLVPLGIYDSERITGALILRMSEPGEPFIGIDGSRSTLESPVPVLADEKGIVHLYPYRDSRRTRITFGTSSVITVACGVEGMRGEDMGHALKRIWSYNKALGGGER